MYWARRALILAVLALVIGLVAWQLWPRPDPVPAVPAISPTVTPSAVLTPSNTPTPTPSQTGPVACVSAGVTLKLSGYQRVKVSGEQVLLLQFTNSGDAPCVVQLSSSTLQIEVSSGSDLIWTTKHCAEWIPEQKKKTLKAGAATEVKITWPLRRSKEKCTKVKDELRPGTYVAKATFDGGASARQVMQLVAG